MCVVSVRHQVPRLGDDLRVVTYSHTTCPSGGGGGIHPADWTLDRITDKQTHYSHLCPAQIQTFISRIESSQIDYNWCRFQSVTVQGNLSEENLLCLVRIQRIKIN